jgi:hypothetical protein
VDAIIVMQGILDGFGALDPVNALKEFFIHGILPFILFGIALLIFVIPPLGSKIKISLAIIIALAGLWLLGVFDSVLSSAALAITLLMAKREGWRNKRPDDSFRHAEAARGRKTTDNRKYSKPIYAATQSTASWFDVTENELKYRIRDPALFDQFSRKKLRKGVSILIGHNPSIKKWEIQALRFDRDVFSIEEARRWVKEHKSVIR